MNGDKAVDATALAEIVWRIQVDPLFEEMTNAARDCVLATDIGRTEFRQAPLHAVVRIHFSNGKMVDVTLAATSGIPDLDQRHLDCFKSLPPELARTESAESDVLIALNWAAP